MKLSILYVGILTLSLWMLTGCSKEPNAAIEGVNTPPTYDIEAISYNVHQGFITDSSLLITDTILQLNQTPITQADFTAAPYKDLRDSICIVVKDWPEVIDTTLKIDKGLFLPAIIKDGAVYYSSTDSIFLDGLSASTLLSTPARKTSSVSITPTPYTGYKVWGTYYRVHYHLPVQIHLVNVLDHSNRSLEAVLYGSFVTNQTRDTKLRVVAFELK